MVLYYSICGLLENLRDAPARLHGLSALRARTLCHVPVRPLPGAAKERLPGNIGSEGIWAKKAVCGEGRAGPRPGSRSTLLRANKGLKGRTCFMDAALSDVVVVDLSRVFAGPFCTMMLGDMGATVIKVEQPGKGDDTRS